MFKLLVLTSLLVAVYAAQYRVLDTEKPAKYADLEGCYVSTIDAVIPDGVASYPTAACEQYYCYKSYGFTVVTTCPTYYFSDPTCAYVDGDATKTFPSCCATVSCTNPDAEVIALD